MKKPEKGCKAAGKHRIFAGFAFGAALVAFVARPVMAQQNDVGPIPQAVVTKEDTFLPGTPQMLAPANSVLTMHPQGRYVLISLNEAPLPYTLLLHKDFSSHAALFLYDARQQRVSTVWEGRGASRSYWVDYIHWLPQSDCALAIVSDDMGDGKEVVDTATASLPNKVTLLFLTLPKVLPVVPSLFRILLSDYKFQFRRPNPSFQ